MQDSPIPPVTLQELEALSDRASNVIERLRDRVFAPGTQKQHSHTILEQNTLVAWSGCTDCVLCEMRAGKGGNKALTETAVNVGIFVCA